MKGRSSQHFSPERGALEFERKVKSAFGFLESQGYIVTHGSSTMVEYLKGRVKIDIYHGRQSYEIGAGISIDGERFTIGELVRTVDAESARLYRNAVATSPDALDFALTELADLFKAVCLPALTDQDRLLPLLRSKRAQWSKDYALDVLAQQVRPQAEAEFRAGNYSRASELYEKIVDRLTDAEIAKLNFAKKRHKIP